ncbi:MAG: restriction endonuclease subunit S [Saprospiraceae bacterium]
MKNWKETSIEEVVLGFFDGPHATPADSETGAVFLGINNLKPEGGIDLTEIKYIAEEDFPKWTRRVLPTENDIVFSYEATLHRYGIIPQKLRCCLGRRLALVRVDPTKANYLFLYYYFLSPIWRGYLESRIISGSTVDRISLIEFPKFKLRLPPLPLQTRIAQILSRYDRLIENCEQQIAALEATARQVYREWFVRGRGPGGAVEEVPLSKIMDLKYGKSLVEEVRIPGDFPVVGSSGIVGSHIEYLVEAPGIVVGRKGNVGSLFFMVKPFFPIDTAFYVSLKEDIGWHFAYFLLCHQNFLSGDAAVPGLNKEQTLSIKVKMPSGSALLAFEKIASPIFSKIQTLQTQITHLRRTRDTLLPRLLSGQLTVTEAS